MDTSQDPKDVILIVPNDDDHAEDHRSYNKPEAFPFPDELDPDKPRAKKKG